MSIKNIFLKYFKNILAVHLKITINFLHIKKNEKGPKTGQAKCLSILGIVATGDCSIDAAAKNGNISEIKSVDVKTFSILGLFSEETTIVTGN